MTSTNMTITPALSIGDRSELYFKDIINGWIKQKRVTLKSSTIAKYLYLINSHIIPELGSTPLSDMSTDAINSFIYNKLQGGRLNGTEKLSASYVRTMVLIVNSIYNYGVCCGMCVPLVAAPEKPTIKKSKITIFSNAEQLLLRDSLSKNITPTGTGILLSLYTGMRIGEVCALRWSDIDFNERIIHINHSIVRINEFTDKRRRTKYIIGSPKTESSDRDIPISSLLYDVLISCRSLYSSEYVVSSTSGFVSPRTFENRYKKIICKLKIQKLNYHSLRHTFATKCIECGVDIKSLSEILGHSNASITMNTYVHSSLEMKRKQIEKIC